MRNALFTECRDFSNAHSKLFVDEGDFETEVFDLMEMATIAHDIYCKEVGCEIDEDGDSNGWQGEHHQKWLQIALRFAEANISISQLIESHDDVIGATGEKK